MLNVSIEYVYHPNQHVSHHKSAVLLEVFEYCMLPDSLRYMRCF
jgi:hypothetical protein